MSGTMFSVEIDDKAVVARLRDMSGKVRQSLERAVETLAIEMQGKVQGKLAGIVLNERTHHLHDSIHYQMDSDARGVVARVGTNVVYAAFHEYGFSGTEQVRAHMRMMSVAFGRPVADPHEILVRAHSRQVNYPAHSFLRSTLAENTGHIRERLTAAVQEAVHES